MKDTIAWAAIAGAITCLVVYFAISMTVFVAALINAGKVAKNLPSDNSSKERKWLLPDILKEIPPVIDSLAKAGPAFWSLVGSMLFLLIALLAAGVF